MSLQSALNPTYSQNAAILTGNPNRVTVDVEDNIDVLFWRDLLGGLQLGKDFHFSPYCTVKAESADVEVKRVTGKSRIMKYAKDFNANHIGCVDSDYDWLLSDMTDYGRELCQNKFLLQTYAYSIENLLCFASALNGYFSEITEENISIDFDDYLNRLSIILYPLLVWSVYLCTKGGNDFALSLWSDILIKEKCKVRLSKVGVEQLSVELESLLSEIKRRVDQKICELKSVYAHEVEKKDELENLLRQNKGVSPDKAYLYVRGHDILGHLVNAVVTPTVEFFRQRHFKELQRLDEKNRVDSLERYNSKQESVSRLIYRNYGYKGLSEIYNKVAQDASMIWA